MAGPRTPTDDKPGYAEPQPKDRDEAGKPHPKKPPNPDEGGLGRDPGEDGSNEGD